MSFFQRLKERFFGAHLPEDYGPIPILEPNRIDPPKNARRAAPAPADARFGAPYSAFPKRILCVCSGNMCRSPYAEARLRALLPDALEAQIVSAGTLRLNGRGAAPLMIAAAQQKGLDLCAHRSRPLTPQLIQAADILFAMDASHATEILRLAPNAASRIVMLGALLDPPAPEIEDPMGQTLEVYLRVCDEIDRALRNWVDPFGFAR